MKRRQQPPCYSSKRIYQFLNCCLFFVYANLFAQPGPTASDLRMQGFEQRKTIEKNSLLSVLKPESIGPSVFSCRVTDVDLDPDNPSRMYVAYASGGLWYSESNGTQFKP
ncbi:MAG: hypothetical protein IT262_20830, partial [Saprospiraceae bacterium]|nr:hypothetical protein [Saprospiraceae bacterium]